MTEELKPCPFCNGLPQKREVNHWTGMRNDLLRVEFIHHCEGLKPRQRATLNVSAVTESEAVDAWNRRATPAPAQPEGQEDEPVAAVDTLNGPERRVLRWVIGVNPADIEPGTMLYAHPSRSAGAAAPVEGAAWQPIETAPKDCTEILAWVKEVGGAMVLMYFSSLKRWGDGITDDSWTPMYWMPIPAAPTSPPQAAQEGKAS